MFAALSRQPQFFRGFLFGKKYLCRIRRFGVWRFFQAAAEKDFLLCRHIRTAGFFEPPFPEKISESHGILPDNNSIAALHAGLLSSKQFEK